MKYRPLFKTPEALLSESGFTVENSLWRMTRTAMEEAGYVNVYSAPHTIGLGAKIKDGHVDICLIKKQDNGQLEYFWEHFLLGKLKRDFRFVDVA